MQNHSLFNGLISTALGLSALCPTAALALGLVDYTASTTLTLSLSTSSVNQDFGTVHIQPVNATGWELRVRSTQGGALRHSSHPSTIPYTLSVDGIQVGSLASGNDTTVLTGSTLSCLPLIGCTLAVRATISTDNVARTPAGSYSDTLVFTLVDQQL
ncbi:hypothetical protein IQ273_17275 [Nodosilinea sp. LEGE 07298]|uniref:hypothetical protein n=1 Tax=Nodosilinea sp. LEGE 07298 TaxID=2777970 RepID=UPI00187FDB63|nr:hypothetical protein [Nodosilinea sp. LEGE 07298]MBE9111159.1 hypothetical protein [Nodosilinea sp. LEGE 07298]